MSEVATSQIKDTKFSSQLNPTAPSFVPTSNSIRSPNQNNLDQNNTSDKKKNRRYRRNKNSKEGEPKTLKNGGSISEKAGSSNNNDLHIQLVKTDLFQSSEQKSTSSSHKSLDSTENSSQSKEKQKELPIRRDDKPDKFNRSDKKKAPIGNSLTRGKRSQITADNYKELTSNTELKQTEKDLTESPVLNSSSSQRSLNASLEADHQNKPKSNKKNLKKNRIPSVEASRAKNLSQAPSSSKKDLLSKKEISPRTLGPRQLVKGLHHLSNNFDVFYKSIVDDSAFLKVALKPTGPDFPYPLERLQLQFRLTSKGEYRCPQDLKVINPEIPRNFAVNLEAALIRRCSQEGSCSTLVANLKWLDSNLASILAQPEASIIKFVRRTPTISSNVSSEPEETINLDSNPGSKEPEKLLENSLSSPSNLESGDYSQSILMSNNQNPTPRINTFSSRRQKEMIHLKNRFRTTFKDIFSSKDITQIQIVLEPTDPEYTLLAYCSSFILNLSVPANYPEAPIELKVSLSSPTSKINEFMINNMSRGFNNYAQQATDKTMFHCINWLSCHVESLLKYNFEDQVSSNKLRLCTRPYISANTTNKEEIEETTSDKDQNTSKYMDYRTMRSEYVSRSDKEFDHISEEEASDSSDSDPERGISSEHTIPFKTPHSGILLRGLSQGMIGISLAHIGHLELDVNCERCRVRLASPRLKPNNRSFFSCPQCNHSLGLQFRPVCLHLSSDSLGYIDTLGCTIFSISRFSLIPTCAKCLHSEALPEFDAFLMNSNKQERCRQCHTRLSYILPEVKFVKLAPTNILESKFIATDSVKILGPAGIKKEKIASQVGSPLPDFGACSHYKKSNRWLRFPCCGKAFPCDKCHDKVSEHLQEFAKSMICGYCSSEMPYSSNFPTCRRCEHTLTSSTRGKSFWEGGKGTRDPKRMNRNDSKKYAGLSKTISRAKQNKS